MNQISNGQCLHGEVIDKAIIDNHNHLLLMKEMPTLLFKSVDCMNFTGIGSVRTCMCRNAGKGTVHNTH